MCNNCKGVVCASSKTCDSCSGSVNCHSRSCGSIKHVVTILNNICITISVRICPRKGDTCCGEVTVFKIRHSLTVGEGGKVDGKGIYMFSGIGAISSHLEGVRRVLRQTREGGGMIVLVNGNIVDHLIVICIKNAIASTIGIASVGCPADSGARSGDTLIINRGSRGLVAGGSHFNRYVVDVNTVGCIRSASRFGHHDGHIVLGGGGGDIESELLVAGADCGIVSILDFGEGAGIGIVRHGTHLERAACTITLNLHGDAHAGKTCHFRQNSVLVADGCARTVTIGIEVQCIW